MNRRDLLKTLALGSLATIGLSRAAQAQTSAPTKPATPPYPGVHRFNVGAFECIALNDGIGRMEGVQPQWAPEGTPEAVKAALERHYLPTDRIHIAFNALVVRTGKETLLLDTGYGAGGRPRTGWLATQLEAAGLRASDISGVFLSHAHGDHFGGLLNEDGTPAFPNAELLLAKDEADFWLGAAPDFSNSRYGEQQRRNSVEGARRVLETLKANTRTLADGDPLRTGLRLLAAPGHTAGHSALRIESDGEELVYLADLAHHPVLMFENPRWTVGFDINPAQAAATRVKLFAELAAKRSRVHFFHMPFPGVGHIRSLGEERYEWVPEMWTVLG